MEGDPELGLNRGKKLVRGRDLDLDVGGQALGLDRKNEV